MINKTKHIGHPDVCWFSGWVVLRTVLIIVAICSLGAFCMAKLVIIKGTVFFFSSTRTMNGLSLLGVFALVCIDRSPVPWVVVRCCAQHVTHYSSDALPTQPCLRHRIPTTM
ncbi:hypothetical protein L210DRAFT_2917258 [Boletus edulis BED1]|uniref:Uncharacterized protein n=1 Tax=Boletus edulis BED1 TaxID=1328754 RepID=A0AAD4C1J4_BOLED|nr:hypothetical protein L210DRAFT_2917258 [Boletus edulis BED1]